MHGFSNRLIAGTAKIFVTPFYIDDDLRARIVLGEHVKNANDCLWRKAVIALRRQKTSA
jgi:hypothetical protein